MQIAWRDALTHYGGDMHVTMVKKRLLSGEPCNKCLQAEATLKARGLWERIDEVVWAQEGDENSAGMRLAAKHGIELAPFFIIRDAGGKDSIFTSVIKFMKEGLGGETGAPVHEASSSLHAEPASLLADAAQRLEAAEPQTSLEFVLRHFGADCAISFSGAEDVVLIEMAVQTGLPFSVFTLDTGRVHPETLRFIDKVRRHYGIEIEVYTPSHQLLEPMIRTKGLFSFLDDGHAECCGIRKVEPLVRALGTKRAWVTGQRMDQSVTRSELKVFHEDPKFRGTDGKAVWKCNPLTHWSSGKVWDLISTRELPYNELHDRGYISIGCEPCTRAVRPGEHERAGRWWWEEATQRECGLHKK
jgi:phosphoadenosine phosphosulfate reductase